ncbi:hypothetical protein PanNE5_38010 [Pandoraea sp. NE5]|uniref:ChaB family protein n=1 Tax=Pandoraea sp. NE5 TaxID=2904129 RepID=UPI0021C437A8|nr:ChaB family protein [Pandoraea sp. NE5]BDD94361.1 hypothetical protein PanNE5_38010 [Pandoraea sp. NE5]
MSALSDPLDGQRRHTERLLSVRAGSPTEESHALSSDRGAAGKRQGSLARAREEIYLKAFNAAWEEYRDPGERRGHESREATAHKVAWAAVKKTYEKDEGSGQWRAKTRHQ